MKAFAWIINNIKIIIFFSSLFKYSELLILSASVHGVLGFSSIVCKEYMLPEIHELVCHCNKSNYRAGR